MAIIESTQSAVVFASPPGRAMSAQTKSSQAWVTVHRQYPSPFGLQILRGTATSDSDDQTCVMRWTTWHGDSPSPASRSPPATMFLWAPVPAPFRELGSLAFCKLLLEEAEVAASPGIGFGEHGEDHVRLALVENRHRLRQAIRNIKTFLGKRGVRPAPAPARALA